MDKQRATIILNGFIDQGDLENAQKAVKFLGRMFTQEELKRLYDSCAKKEYSDTIKKIFELNISEKLRREILDYFIDQGDLENAQKAVKYFNRTLNPKELKRLCEACVKKEYWESIPDITEQRGVSQEYRQEICDILVEKNEWHRVLDITRQGVSQEYRQKICDILEDEEKPHRLIDGITEQGVSQECREKACDFFIDKEWFEYVIRIIKQGVSQEYLKKICDFFIDKEWFEDALDVLKLLQSN